MAKQNIDREATKQLATPIVDLDWQAYYRTFKETHGGDPVPYQGRLLFPDGYMYSSNDFMGPEFAPETPKQQRRLSQIYWLKRRKCVQREHDWLERQIQTLDDFQHTKSAPLQQRVTYYSEESHSKVTETVELSLDNLRGRLAWLEADINACQLQLKELRDDSEQNPSP